VGAGPSGPFILTSPRSQAFGALFPRRSSLKGRTKNSVNNRCRIAKHFRPKWNRSCAYFIGTSSHCVFSNTIQNLPCSGPRTRSRWGIRTGMRTRARLLKQYHAEVVAHRTGEPFGTLVLAVAVTIIEVALIVSVMVAAPAEKAGLARDTVFAAVMIVCNGIVGLCLLWGGARHHEQGFQVHGASAALAVLAALTMLTLVLPNFATSVPGPLFSTSQLVFAGT